MNIINSKKDNLRVVVFCDDPSKLKREDVSSFDYVIQLDFTESFIDFFDKKLIDFTYCRVNHYPTVYDLKNTKKQL